MNDKVKAIAALQKISGDSNWKTVTYFLWVLAIVVVLFFSLTLYVLTTSTQTTSVQEFFLFGSPVPIGSNEDYNMITTNQDDTNAIYTKDED